MIISRPIGVPARVRRALQFCLAHLIRDVEFLTTLPDARDRLYGTRLREALRELFG